MIKKIIKRMLKPVNFLLRPFKRVIVLTLRPFFNKPLLYRRKSASASDKPTVIVAGRNYCSNICMARALGSAGYEVEVLRIYSRMPRPTRTFSMLRPDAHSKYVRAFHACFISRSDPHIIVDRLRKIADPNRKMLLVPVDDLVLETVDTYADELRPFYYLPNIGDKQGEIVRAMGKEIQYNLAKEAGLPVINSCLIKIEDDIFQIPDCVSYPCFIKPNVSPDGRKTQMQMCQNKEELQLALENLAKKHNAEILVQDYLQIKQEYSILGICTRDGAFGPGFFGADVGGHQSRRGVALTGHVVPNPECQELIDRINRFVGSLNFEGLYDVDLIETTDGKMYFVEVNLRYGGSGYAIVASGVNLPAMYADYVTAGKPIDDTARVDPKGLMFVNEKNLLEEIMYGFVRREEGKELLQNTDIRFIYNAEDEKPYRHYQPFFKLAVMRGWVRNLVNPRQPE